MIRVLAITVLALAFLGCEDTQMSLLDQELGKYRYEQEQYRGESLEELYFEETMRCENLTTEIMEVRRQIELRSVELGEVKARLAEIEAQLAEAQKQLAAAEKKNAPAEQPKPTPNDPAGKPAPPAKPPQNEPAKTLEKPPAGK